MFPDTATSDVARAATVEPMALEVRGLTKAYGDATVLRDVSIDARQRETVGIIGENGAGKSTLLNIISGTARPGTGSMRLTGEDYAPRSYHEANLRGVFRIFQELSLVPTLSVAENFYLSHEAHFTRFGFLDTAKMRRRASDILDRYEHAWIDPGSPVGEHKFATRQVVEIIKTLALADLLEVTEPVLLFDEPTAALVHDELVFFKALMRRASERATILFVSHHVSELLEMSERVYVLKDGHLVAERPSSELDEGRIHSLMVGRERSADYYREPEQRTPEADVALKISGFSGSGFHDVDLSVHAGEIVGIAGVLGSGKSELGRALASGEGVENGSLAVDGTAVRARSASVMQRHGVCYVPPERKEEGVILGASVAQNVALGRVARSADSHVLVSPRGDARRARDLIRTLRIKCRSSESLVEELSGGNQQKVVFARWLATGVRVLVMDNPTRGVDAGGKEEIYETMRALADDRTAIVLISDDLLELIGLSNRVLVMRSGRVSRELASPADDKPSEIDLIDAMV